MNHKEEVKLHRFLTKARAMSDIAMCMLEGNGVWYDGTRKDKLVFKVNAAEISDTTVHLSKGYGQKYIIKLGGEFRIPFNLTDKDLEELIDLNLTRKAPKVVASHSREALQAKT